MEATSRDGQIIASLIAPVFLRRGQKMPSDISKSKKQTPPWSILGFVFLTFFGFWHFSYATDFIQAEVIIGDQYIELDTSLFGDGPHGTYGNEYWKATTYPYATSTAESCTGGSCTIPNPTLFATSSIYSGDGTYWVQVWNWAQDIVVYGRVVATSSGQIWSAGGFSLTGVNAVAIYEPVDGTIFATTTIPLHIYFINYDSWEYMTIQVNNYDTNDPYFIEYVDMNAYPSMGFVDGFVDWDFQPASSTSWELVAYLSHATATTPAFSPRDAVYFHFGAQSDLFYDREAETYEDVECNSIDDVFDCGKKLAMYLFIPKPSSIRTLGDISYSSYVPFGYADMLIEGITELFSIYNTGTSTDISIGMTMPDGSTTSITYFDKDIVQTYSILGIVRSLIDAGLYIMFLLLLYQKATKLFEPTKA